MPPDSRKEQGKHPTRWTKGTSGNPSGRPGKGAEIRRQLMDLTPDAMNSITEGIKAGDTACLKIWADRCDPVSKTTMPTVEFLADTTDLTRFSMSVLAAISRGEVTPDIGAHIINAAASVARVAEIDEVRREMKEILERLEDMENDKS
ncbi:hypothetical protein [Rosenbergiella epipactidis]|uniref:hypothetical protein n=1 Tax=Rosenbergiella epipactidis TaxID=1544694 RepID=UPI001F4D3CB4|nr:hypothetical protein [Rosenbergiella epipactidis]